MQKDFQTNPDVETILELLDTLVFAKKKALEPLSQLVASE